MTQGWQQVRDARLRPAAQRLAWDPRLGAQVVDSASAKGLENPAYWSILVMMAENLLEFAQKMAQAARAGLAVERKRLKEILAERQREQLAQPGPHSR